MRNAWKIVPAVSLAMAIGCQSKPGPTSSVVDTQPVEELSAIEVGEGVTLVRLKVPNMV